MPRNSAVISGSRSCIRYRLPAKQTGDRVGQVARNLASTGRSRPTRSRRSLLLDEKQHHESLQPLVVQTSTVKKSTATIRSQCIESEILSTWSCGCAPAPVPSRAVRGCQRLCSAQVYVPASRMRPESSDILNLGSPEPSERPVPRSRPLRGDARTPLRAPVAFASDHPPVPAQQRL